MATNSEIEKLEKRWQENPLGLTFAPLAEAYRKAGETARALELLDVGLAQHPNYVPAHIVRGRCHTDAHSVSLAESAYRRVVELDPENVIALRGLADLAESEGRLSDAVGRLETLLDVDRNNEDARGHLDRVRELMVSPEALGTETLKPFEPADLSPAPDGEFQLADELLALSPSDDRFPEIVLQAEELEQGLPVPEAAQGRDMIAEPDPLAARGMSSLDEDPIPEASELSEETFELEQDIAPGAASEPEPPHESLPDPEPETVFTDEMPLLDEPVVSLDAEAGPEPAREPAAEVDAAGTIEEPELVVTETMAEIFLRQGHGELARAVYSQLLQRDPSNERVAAAFARLSTELAPEPEPTPPTPPVPVVEAPPRYDAVTTGGRSVAELFGVLLSVTRPSAAAQIHPPAFEAPRRPSGDPTRPAADSLSLSSVFGEEAAAGPAGVPPEPATGEPSFEQFFTSGEGPTAEMELPKPAGGEAGAISAMAPEDLEQFNAWLRGLKR